jgi:hypothetical protein
MATMIRPDRTEAAEYYFRYIDRVGDDVDVVRALEDQLPETLALLRGISDERSLHRYGPDKWSIREVVNHLSDTERLFGFRALWFGRGFDSPLPSFEQEIAKAAARADERPWQAHIEEFAAVRESTIHFFRNLPDDAWNRRGVASGNPFSVRALAYLAVGHVIHHVSILRERYL